jgi:hypothetical protein
VTTPHAPPTRVSPAHRQRLTHLFMRLQQQGRDDATTVVRRELRGVVSPEGKVRNRAIDVTGDVVGEIDNLEVVGIGHHPIADGTPANGSGLVYRTSDSHLHWELNAGGGRWEPLTNGDVDATELIFEDGDVLMDGPFFD